MDIPLIDQMLTFLGLSVTSSPERPVVGSEILLQSSFVEGQPITLIWKFGKNSSLGETHEQGEFRINKINRQPHGQPHGQPQVFYGRLSRILFLIYLFFLCVLYEDELSDL